MRGEGNERERQKKNDEGKGETERKEKKGTSKQGKISRRKKDKENNKRERRKKIRGEIGDVGIKGVGKEKGRGRVEENRR